MVYTVSVPGTLTKTAETDALIESLKEERNQLTNRLQYIDRALEKALSKRSAGKGTKRKPIVRPTASPLDDVNELIEATEDLRVANGNLSATAVANAFGVSVNQLAGWLKRSRQAIGKTPDADSLQDELAFFERVARLRAAVPQDRFLKWLRMPHDSLDGKTPLKLLAEGEGQVVVDFVEDMLTGAPS